MPEGAEAAGLRIIERHGAKSADPVTYANPQPEAFLPLHRPGRKLQRLPLTFHRDVDRFWTIETHSHFFRAVNRAAVDRRDPIADF